jgi:DNA-binding LacI/PurR family transcriptional regulator
LCARLDVSRVTVRGALAVLRREGTIHSVPGKGSFRSAEGRPRPLSLENAVLGLFLHDIDSYSVDIVGGVVREARVHGMRVQPHADYANPEEQRRQLKSIARQPGLKAVLVNPPARIADAQTMIPIYNELRRGGVCVLLLNTSGFTFGFPHVGFDDRGGMAIVVRHVLGLGHRRLAYVTAERSEDSVRAAVRLAGYRAALRALGGASEALLVTDRGYARKPEERFQPDPVALARRRAATAFVAQNDNAAAALCAILGAAGLRVPEDVSVTGYDHLPSVPYSFPVPLTTTRRDRTLLGVTAFRAVLGRLASVASESEAVHEVLLPVELLIGQSVACLDPKSKSLPSRESASAKRRGAGRSAGGGGPRSGHGSRQTAAGVGSRE